MSAINGAALERLIREAMASGVVCFTDRMGAGEVDRNAPLTEAFGGWPADFIAARPDLVNALTAGGAS